MSENRPSKHIKRMLIVEGGAKGTLAAECRKAFQDFLIRAGVPNGPKDGVLPSVIPAGGRSEAYRRFCKELAGKRAEDVITLLVDSEGPLTSSDPWQHVKERRGDEWSQPEGADPDDLHFMVQMMEAWFLADPDTLELYFKKNFHRNKLPDLRHRQLESISKDDVYKILEAATKDTPVPYTKKSGKGPHSFALLGKIDPRKVEEASPAAAVLLRRLKSA